MEYNIILSHDHVLIESVDGILLVDTDEISCDQLKSMLTDNIHHMSYYHLTTWPSLCKMMEHVTVPDDGTKHRMLHLSAAVNMNDRDDKKCGNGVYFSSFSFGPAENISMWTNYGIPNEEAVRVRFYYRVFIEWIQTLRHSIKVYGVNPDGSLTSLSAKPEIKLVDVAYWSQDKRQGRYNDPNDGIFIHDRNKFRLQKLLKQPAGWRLQSLSPRGRHVWPAGSCLDRKRRSCTLDGSHQW